MANHELKYIADMAEPWTVEGLEAARRFEGGPMTTHTNYNTGEACDCDRPDDNLAHVLDAENFYLWDDLDLAMGQAANGRWSMQCDWLVERIVMLERAGALRPERGSLPFTDDRWLLAVASVDKALREDR